MCIKARIVPGGKTPPSLDCERLHAHQAHYFGASRSATAPTRGVEKSNDLIQTGAGFQIAENKRTVTAHAAGIAVHDVEIGVASDRAELSGPFYQNTFEFNKTPFYPSDYGVDTAGRFGRDDGVNIWGSLGPGGRLAYVVGAFDGLNGGANLDDNLLIAGRVSYNFWEVEQNPGYYASSTYFGGGGDIFTIGLAAQHQADGAGTAGQPTDFTGISFDVLMEKALGAGVLTLEGEYKTFDVDLNPLALADPNCFCLFDGNAWTATALYLAGQETVGGRLQPYFRYTSNRPDNSADRDEIEVGVNLILDGHNTRLSLMYQYGDIATKGRVWLPGVTGRDVSAIKLGLQFQL